MLVSLTVGKVDAGVAVLLTEDKRLIEFPSILLPEDIHSGSIVDVNVSRNVEAEISAAKSFASLQSSILSAFGSDEPSTPTLRCRNATQTSVVLEWDPVSLATADLRTLTLYRNGSKAGAIPKPFENTSTKISGLAVDTEYTFALVLRTSAGTYSSEKLVVKTHKMTDLSGITITPGIMAPELRESLERTVDKMGAKMIEQVRIDTTHFVCTEGRGPAWEKAVQMNVPVVVPDWVKGCEREGRIVGVRGYYLNADPKLRQVGAGAALQREESTTSVQTRPQETPRTEITPPTPERSRAQAPTDGDDDDESEDGEGSDDEKKSGRPATATTSQGASPTLDKSDNESSIYAEGSVEGDIEKRDSSSKADDSESEDASSNPNKAPPTPGQGQFDDVDL